MVVANDDILSDLAKSAIKGNRSSYLSLIKLLNEIDHPVLSEMDLRARGKDVLSSILLPISSLILSGPHPRIHLQSLTWEAGGRPHATKGPAELWFDHEYLGYYINGIRHRVDGPSIIDISNNTIWYFLNGQPRTHEKGPFKVEKHDGRTALTYVMGERMAIKKGNYALHSSDDASAELWLADDEVSREYVEEPGDHVIVTHSFVDIEGVGKSEPTEEDFKNLAKWSVLLRKYLAEGEQYLENYLNTFA